MKRFSILIGLALAVVLAFGLGSSLLAGDKCCVVSDKCCRADGKAQTTTTSATVTPAKTQTLAIATEKSTCCVKPAKATATSSECTKVCGGSACTPKECVPGKPGQCDPSLCEPSGCASAAKDTNSK